MAIHWEIFKLLTIILTFVIPFKYVQVILRSISLVCGIGVVVVVVVVAAGIKEAIDDFVEVLLMTVVVVYDFDILIIPKNSFRLNLQLFHQDWLFHDFLFDMFSM